MTTPFVDTRRLFLVCYDSDSGRRRRHLHHLVAQATAAGQRSAYECWLKPAARVALVEALRKEMAETDRLLVVALDARCPAENHGRAMHAQPDDVLVIA